MGERCLIRVIKKEKKEKEEQETITTHLELEIEIFKFGNLKRNLWEIPSC